MVDMAKKTIWGEQLKKLRRQKGLSQPEAAAKLEIPLKTLRNWEQGRATPATYFQRLVMRLLRES